MGRIPNQCLLTYLTFPTAIPLVATAGAHELGLPFLAALTLWHFVFMELRSVTTAGGNNYTRFIAMAIVARIVCRSVMVMIVTLIDDQAVHAVIGFVVLEGDGRGR